MSGEVLCRYVEAKTFGSIEAKQFRPRAFAYQIAEGAFLAYPVDTHTH